MHSLYCIQRWTSVYRPAMTVTVCDKQTRPIIMSRALSAEPISLMQWWTRPGPRRPCAISKPRPSPSRMLSVGTRTLSNSSSAWPSDNNTHRQTQRIVSIKACCHSRLAVNRLIHCWTCHSNYTDLNSQRMVCLRHKTIIYTQRAECGLESRRVLAIV